MPITKTYQPLAAGAGGYGTALAGAAMNTETMNRLMQIHQLFAPLLEQKKSQESQQNWQSLERQGTQAYTSQESAKDRALQQEQMRLQKELQTQSEEAQQKLKYPNSGMYLDPNRGWIPRNEKVAIGPKWGRIG